MKLRKMSHRENGQKLQSRKWYAVFSDYTGTMRRLPLFEDRKASEEAGRKVNRLNSLAASADNVPPELSRWVENGMPGDMRERLAAWGILAASSVAAAKPLADHLADFEQSLLDKGNTPRHAAVTAARVRRVFGGCGFKFWPDLSASRVQAHLAERRKPTQNSKGISAASFNYYLQSCNHFCRWMIKDRRAHENPLGHLDNLNTKTDRRHDRRALAVDELRQLLTTTDAGPERFGMTGQERAMLYRLAVETGLRVAELRSLMAGSFALDGTDTTVTIAAAYAKNRRQDTLPLRGQTADALRVFLSGKMPAAVAFNMPRRESIIAMLRADLADGRQAWLEAFQTPQDREQASEGAFLSPVDAAGRYVDFHALRHTFISNLAAGGVHPKTAQQLARHSTITLTMDRYTHVRAADCADALDVLPDLRGTESQAMRATGTDGRQISLPAGLLPESGFERIPAESGGVSGGRMPGREIFENARQPLDIRGDNLHIHGRGLVAELADAMDSKSIVLTDIPVRLRSRPLPLFLVFFT